MTRLIAIGVLIAIAVLLFRYRTNEKLQKGVILASIIGFVIYVVSVMTMELIN
ncbi:MULTISPECIES: hypothetical protein [Vibrio]|uniref:Uncharacterized protein n=1 Tax=Vibrio penaeicida TaxID=104609 RepID=A0AAV5NW77_9VIBR|nr:MULTISPECIES: hypothetical protein [Vibrio]MDP2574421.1 hypothetical protein [Vibrio penaeicida]GLQ74830.1 hypothetical protein GCM10007932_41920 [Vibrio penaeicida]